MKEKTNRVKLTEWKYKNKNIKITRYRVINKEGFFYNFDIFDIKKSNHHRVGNYGILARNYKDAKKHFKEAIDGLFEQHNIK